MYEYQQKAKLRIFSNPKNIKEEYYQEAKEEILLSPQMLNYEYYQRPQMLKCYQRPQVSTLAQAALGTGRDKDGLRRCLSQIIELSPSSSSS